MEKPEAPPKPKEEKKPPVIPQAKPAVIPQQGKSDGHLRKTDLDSILDGNGPKVTQPAKPKGFNNCRFM